MHRSGGYAVFSHYRFLERMTGQIHGHVLFDAALFRNLFQIGVQALVARYGQHFVRFHELFCVFPYNHLWDGQQWHMNEGVSLFPCHENPLLAVFGVDVFFPQGFQLLIVQAGETCKDEKVAHLFQTRGVKCGFHQSCQFLLIQAYRPLLGSQLSFYRSHICPPRYNVFMVT